MFALSFVREFRASVTPRDEFQWWQNASVSQWRSLESQRGVH